MPDTPDGGNPAEHGICARAFLIDAGGLNAHLQSTAALAGKPFLLVLDDAWHPEDLTPFRHFATPGHALLLTTRDLELARRFAGEPDRVVRVAELDEDAAVGLLGRACPEALC